MIAARGLARSYGGHRVLAGIDLTVAPGELVGFVGPNGAGKTTTMRCLVGALRAHGGEVDVAKPIGYLAENAALYEQHTVRAHLRFVARARAVTRPDDAVDRVGELTDITALMARPITRLSRGQKQRVGLAAALVGAPPALVLDEPTQGLDPAQIVAAREAITDAAARGAAVLFSTHLLHEAAALCDRVVVIAAGQTVADVPRSDFADLEERFLRLVGEVALR